MSSKFKRLKVAINFAGGCLSNRLKTFYPNNSSCRTYNFNIFIFIFQSTNLGEYRNTTQFNKKTSTQLYKLN